MTDLREKINEEMADIRISDVFIEETLELAKKKEKGKTGRRLFLPKIQFASACLAVVLVAGLTVAAGYYRTQDLHVNQDAMPDIDPMTVQPFQLADGLINTDNGDFTEYEKEYTDYGELQADIGKDLLDTPYADKKPESILYTTDAESNEQIKITSYIVNYAWNTPVNLEIDIAISPEQLNGFTYDFLGYYEFVEQYTSVQGWKVNVIGSVGAESYHLMFTADGIRYHLYGGAPLYRLKDVVDSME